MREYQRPIIEITEFEWENVMDIVSSGGLDSYHILTEDGVNLVEAE